MLIEELESLPIDYKASVLAAELLNAGFPEDQLYFKKLSIFHRHVGRDVENFVIDDDVEEQLRLVLEVNREGLYDMIPESITHATLKKGDTEDINEFFQRRRNEENQARKFFNPIENEFEQRILTFEMIEREICFKNNFKNNRAFFEFFYGNSSALDDQQVLILLYILPLSHKVRGNQKLIGIILSLLLHKKVNVRKNMVIKEEQLPDDRNDNQTVELGVNFILTGVVHQPIWEYAIDIHDIGIEEFDSFSKRGRSRNIIDFILPYVLPTTAHEKLNMHVNSKTRNFSLGGDDICYLEFNSYI